jgi:hypothetical protein
MKDKHPYNEYRQIEDYISCMDAPDLRAFTTSMVEFIDEHIGSKIQRYAFFTAYIELMTRDLED